MLHSVCMPTERDFLREFGIRVAMYRKQTGITQEKLAEIVGVHRTYVGFIEQGRRNPSIAKMYRIAAALNVSLRELFEPF